MSPAAPGRPSILSAPQVDWWSQAPDESHWAHWYSVSVSGRIQSINGNTLLLYSQMPRRQGFLYVVRRVWAIFGTASTGDNATNYTSIAFRSSASGVLGTYDTIGTLDTKAAPGAGKTIELAAYYPITDQRVLHVLTTLVLLGVSHDLDSFTYGVDIGAKRITVEVGR